MKDKQTDNVNSRKKLFTARNIIIFAAIVIILGAGAVAGLVKASDNPAFCTSCHIMQPYYQSWDSSDLLANKHAAAGVTCHQCHESSVLTQAEEGLKFITGDYKTPLDKRNLGTRDFCLACHDFDTVKSKTNFDDSNPHDSHQGEQDCNLCHNMHQQSQLMCSQCHQFSWADKLDESWKEQ
ncbi:MAG TPA: cytochrome c3 family protein [Syntrophomonas sp.]|jgi:cytochrome c nitrite reductase small subunit|nr:cytochrome c3 family protein [Syntrophomonas sp.]